MCKALVIGYSYSRRGHEYKVRCAFLNDAPDMWTCDIAIKSGSTVMPMNGPIVTFEPSRRELYDFAIQEGYDLVIDTQQNVWTRKQSLDKALDNGTWPIQAHGANFSACYDDPPRLFSAIVCSGGTCKSQNKQSYGPGLEMYREGYVFKKSGLQKKLKQSYGTPAIAALMAHAKSAGYGFWDARALLRSLGTNGKWSCKEGFGYVSPKPAYFKIPKNKLPLYGPVDVSIVGEGNQLVIRWRNFESTRWKSTVIYSNGERIYEGTGAYFKYEYGEGEKELVFYSQDEDGNLSTLQKYDIHSCVIMKKETDVDIHDMLRKKGKEERGVLLLKVEDSLPSGRNLADIMQRSNLSIDKGERGEIYIHQPTLGLIKAFSDLVPTRKKRGYLISYAAFIPEEFDEEDWGTAFDENDSPNKCLWPHR